MAHILKPPEPLPACFSDPSLFLAGSIEMGRAIHWQKRIELQLQPYNVTILNPRRDNWDSSWVQERSNPQFAGQVRWELEAQERADRILMYFDPDTQAPITLLELGLFAHSGRLRVCCPVGYWRKGNVDIVCERYQIVQLPTLDELCADAERWAAGDD